MPKTAIIFGAGAGLGKALARKFSQEGYGIVLVARGAEGLARLAAGLKADGVQVETVSADLSKPGEAGRVVTEVMERHGSVDALYYGPTSAEDFVPASGIRLQEAAASLDLIYLGLVSAVSAALPDMRRRGEGIILTALGGSAALGLPFMSGPGPAMAAARNYIQAVHGEVISRGIFAGMLTLSAVIRGSAYHRRIASGAISMNLPKGFVVPEVDADDLADRLWAFAADKDRNELVFPPR